MSVLDRPYLASEIAATFDVSTSRLNAVIRRHRIEPAMLAGRTRLYGPQQIRAIYAALAQSA
jgi:hypothetical protein